MNPIPFPHNENIPDALNSLWEEKTRTIKWFFFIKGWWFVVSCYITAALPRILYRGNDKIRVNLIKIKTTSKIWWFNSLCWA